MTTTEEFYNSLRKNYDSFLPHHKLRDAGEEYANAIYRFRKAEASGSDDYCAARVEMNRLEMKLLNIRKNIYAGNTDQILQQNKAYEQVSGPPKPKWIKNISKT